MHDHLGSRREEANLFCKLAFDQLAVGDASSALHSVVQALRHLGVSSQAQQAAVCQCVTASAARPCSRKFRYCGADTTCLHCWLSSAAAGVAVVTGFGSRWLGKQRALVKGDAVQQLAGLLAACELQTKQVAFEHGEQH